MHWVIYYLGAWIGAIIVSCAGLVLMAVSPLGAWLLVPVLAANALGWRSAIRFRAACVALDAGRSTHFYIDGDRLRERA